MKWVRTAIGAVIAISVIPAIILTVINVTELKDVKNVQFELLSEEDGNFFITSGTYDKLIEHKNIINYDIESNFTLITHEELDRGTWRVNDELYNEIIDRESNPRIVENVGKLVLNGSEEWIYVNDNLFVIYNASQFNMVLNTDDSNKIITNQEGFEIYTTTDLVLRTTTSFTSSNDLKQYLSQNPLTVTYELAIKNPKIKVIENGDIFTFRDNLSSEYNYVIIKLPNDSVDKNLADSIIVSGYSEYLAYNSAERLVGVGFPKETTYEQAKSELVGKTLIYELAQPRLAEQYDLSTFKLTFDDDRIRVLFDINDSYYLWEITNDDRLIPLNGQHEVGNTWTVKFYVYEIQQPLIRSLVLLIPLIVISGLLYYLYIVVSKRE